MPIKLKIARLALFMWLASIATLAQEQQMTSGPIPAQVASAKRIFISNGGEETFYRLPKDAWYSGGPNRTYNQFYAAMRNWGRYELVASPTDADLVFELSFLDRYEGATAVSQFKLTILDAKTRFALWRIFRYADWAGMAKNREKNYDTAMSELVDDVKLLALSAQAQPSK